MRAEFGNGDWFYARSGMQIEFPERRADRPNRESLEWQADTVFRQ